jgi:hypothetical protein
MKTCSTCKLEKSFNEFRKDSSKKDGYQPRCKCCVKARTHQRYKELYHVKAKIGQASRRKNRYTKLKDYIINHGGCIVCGENDQACIDFHHLDPNKKEFSISQSTNLQWELVEQEIAKCIMLCANHHRLVHWDNFDLTPYLKNNGELAERSNALVC